MTAVLIDGKILAQDIQLTLKKEVEQLSPKLGRAPGLAVVLVGQNPASKVYVKSKSKKAKDCGIYVVDVALDEKVTDSELQDKLHALSADPRIDGILLQLPLPKHLDEFSALCAISADKDADGLHPTNQGLLLRGAAAPRPCTPFGVMKLIEKACTQLNVSTNIAGKKAVVVGRSILVGKPQALLLLEQNCTVEICHSKTKDLKATCREADILVAAIGKAKMINQEYIKPGAIVIDVGINHDENGQLCGDVDFESAKSVAGAITPVPGGVGPMTITMLLFNTVEAAKKKVNK